MIFLVRYHPDDPPAIAVVEDARHATRYEAQGYQRCSREAFRAAWRERNKRQIAALMPETETAPLMREAVA